MKTQHIHRFITLIYLCLFLALWGCSENSLTFQVRFSEVSGLVQGDPVYFDNNEIGKVKKISYTSQGDYLIEVNIAPEFKNAATEDSRFFITHSPAGKPHMAVIVEQERPGGVVLKSGSVVQGSIKKGYLDDVLGDLQKTAGEAQKQLNTALQELRKSFGANSDKLNSELQATLDDLSARFNKFAEELGKVPDSQEVQQLEESLNRFADEFQKAQKDVQDYLRNEIIPRLRLELERLHNQLKKEGRENELENIDRQVKELDMV